MATLGLTLDLTPDYLIFDGLEPVLLIVKAGGSVAEGKIPNAKRFEVTRALRPYTGGINLTGDELLWLIAQREMQAVGITEINLRDKITDAAGIVYQAVSVKRPQMTGLWWVTTRLQPQQGQ